MDRTLGARPSPSPRGTTPLEWVLGPSYTTLPTPSHGNLTFRTDFSQALNCHPAPMPRKSPPPSGSSSKSLKASFRIGVSEDRNKRCRRTMEDAHSFVYDFGGVRGQGYFAVFESAVLTPIRFQADTTVVTPASMRQSGAARTFMKSVIWLVRHAPPADRTVPPRRPPLLARTIRP